MGIIKLTHTKEVEWRDIDALADAGLLSTRYSSRLMRDIDLTSEDLRYLR